MTVLTIIRYGTAKYVDVKEGGGEGEGEGGGAGRGEIQPNHPVDIKRLGNMLMAPNSGNFGRIKFHTFQKIIHV